MEPSHLSALQQPSCTHKKWKNPLTTLSFLVRDAFYILQKKDKDTLHGSICREKKWASRSLALALDSQHQTQFLSLPPDSIKSWENHMILDSYKHASILVLQRNHTCFRHWLWKARLLPDAFVVEVNPHSTEDCEQQCPGHAEAVNSDVTSICEAPSSASLGLNKIHRHRMTELQVICHLAIFTTHSDERKLPILGTFEKTLADTLQWSHA